MQKTILLNIIRKLSSQEFRKFGEYVHSPFFNKNEGVIKLYDYIALNYPELEEKMLDKEMVYGKLFPGVKYNQSFMKMLIFNLSHLAEDFLGYIRYKKDPVETEIYLLKELYDRKVEGLFLKKLRNAEENLDKTKYKNEDFFLKKYKIQSARKIYMVDNQRFLNYKDLPGQDTYPQSESLLKFFFITILHEYRLLYTQKKIVNFDFKTGFLEKVIGYLKEEHQKFDCPLLELNFYELLLLRERKPLYYHKIKQLFIKGNDGFTWLDKFNALSILSGFAIEQFYNGDLSYMKERFELHNMVLDYKLYSLEDGFFDEQLFINMVVVGIQMRQLDWTEKFMKQYKHFLDPEKRDTPYRLSCSRLSFAMGEHEAALEHLSKLASLDTASYKASVKNLTLMIYYELGWDAQASEVIDTYRHFLARDNVLPTVQRERSINFLKFYSDLLKLKLNNKPKLSNKLRSELTEKYNVIERQWLLEKALTLDK